MANLKAKAYYKHHKVCFLTLNPIHLYSTTVQHDVLFCFFSKIFPKHNQSALWNPKPKMARINPLIPSHQSEILEPNPNIFVLKDAARSCIYE